MTDDLEQRAKEVAEGLRDAARLRYEGESIPPDDYELLSWADKLDPSVKREGFWMVWDRHGNPLDHCLLEDTAVQRAEQINGTCKYYPSPDDEGES